MKRMLMAITMLALSTVLLTNAEAGDRRVGGLLLGGGTGAIVSNEIQRQHGPGYHPAQATVYSKSYGDRRYQKTHQPAYRGYRDNCRRIVTIKSDHHRTKRVVTTICDNNYRHHYKYRFRDRF